MKRYSIRNRLFFTMMSISVPVMIILLLMCSYTKTPDAGTEIARILIKPR